MANKKRQTISVKKKKKHWYPILASTEFNNVEIGECFLDDVQLLKGRKITAGVTSLIRDPKKQSTKITFRVSEVKENKGITEITAYKIMPSHVKRISKRAKSKVEDSYEYTTKDGKIVRIKPLITSKNLASKAVKTSLRLRSREILTNFCKKSTYKEVIKNVLSNGLQMEIKKNSKKILPLSIILIKSASLVEPKK